MKVKEMNRFPQMKRKDLRRYLKKKNKPPVDESNKIVEESKSDPDLENAAPEEHHPSEENLQRVLIQVPMPGFVRPRQHSGIQPNQYIIDHQHFIASDYAQDELLPGEERKMPPQLSIFSLKNHGKGQKERRMMNNRIVHHNGIEPIDDMVDEGEDVHNRHCEPRQ